MASQSHGTKSSRRSEREAIHQEWEQYDKGTFRFEPFTPMNEMQSKLFDACLDSPMVIALGPAGTAKSFCEASAAIRLLTSKNQDSESGQFKQIILTRSPVPTGHSTGFNPGSEEEKLSPWLSPIIDNLKKVARTDKGSDGFYNYLAHNGRIKMREMESIKGSSWDDSVIIVEESQELTMEQLKNLSTRAGQGSKVFFNGDIAQENDRVKGRAYLQFVDAVKRSNARILKKIEAGEELEEWEILVPIIEFRKEDCVRSGICRLMIEIYEAEGF